MSGGDALFTINFFVEPLKFTFVLGTHQPRISYNSGTRCFQILFDTHFYVYLCDCLYKMFKGNFPVIQIVEGMGYMRGIYFCRAEEREGQKHIISNELMM